MKRPPLLPIVLVGLVAGVAWFGYQARQAQRGEQPFTLLERARALRIEHPNDYSLPHSMLNRALDQGPGDALKIELLRERADIRETSGALELARRDYERLLELEPDDLALAQRLAGVLKQLGEEDAANAIWASLLDKQPGNGWFRSQAALIKEEAWTAELLALDDQLARYIGRQDLNELKPEIRRLVHLPAADPATRGILAELEPRMPAEAFAILQIEAPRLRLLYQDIRYEYASSIKGGPNRLNLFAVIDSLYAAERMTGVVDFGLAAMAFDASTTHPGIVQDLARALNRLDRSRAATLAVNSVTGKDVQWYGDFLDGWCEILYSAENWPQLINGANLVINQAQLRPDQAERLALGTFYKGIAAFELGRDEEAVANLRQFINSRTAGPQPESRGRAFDACTQALERLGRQPEANNMMVTWSEAAPESSARPWMHRADLMADAQAQHFAEANLLARAINADPSLTDELVERMDTAGQLGLAENGINLANIAFQSRNNKRWYPAGDVAPYTLYALADHYMRTQQPIGADLVLRRLLRDLPQFVPAMDLRAKAQLTMGNDLEYADVLLARLEASGSSLSTQAALRDLSSKMAGKRLPGDLLVRWMEMDPEFTGAIELTRQLAQDDLDVEAFFTMNNVDRTRFTDTDRLMYSDVLITLDRYETILTATQPIGEKSEFFVEANVLRLLAAAKTGNRPAIDAALTVLEERPLEWQLDSTVDQHATLAFQALLTLADRAPLVRFAHRLAEAPGVRSGARMNQAALADMLANDHAGAQVWLVRADGLSMDGAPLAGRLVLAVMADDKTAIARAVRDLRREAPPWTTLRTPAYLAALERRFGEARALIEERLNADPTDARLWLASAALDALAGVAPASTQGAYTTFAGLDPLQWLGTEATALLPVIASTPEALAQRILALLLASDAPVWKAWSLNRVTDKTYAELLGPFGAELALNLSIESGAVELADLDRVRKRFPSFVPFWDMYEDFVLESVGRNDHPDLLNVRRERRNQGVPPRGGKAPTPVEVALDASWTAANQDRPAVALARAQEAAELAPGTPAVQLNLARTARTLQPSLSQAAYLSYLLDHELDVKERSAIFAELVELGLPLSLEQLDALIRAYPDAPEPQLARAMQQLTQPAEINATLAELERFAKRQAPLEELSPGSSRKWFNVIARYSPERALALVQGQLEKNPRFIDLWVQRAEGLDRMGERDAALELLRTAVRMSPDPRASIALAKLLAEIGGPHEEVTAALNTARRSPELPNFVDQLEFIATASLANIGAEFADDAIRRMEQLLAKPELKGVDRLTIQRRLGAALLHRAQAGDGQRALPHLEAALTEARDTLDRDLLLGLRNLATRLDGALAKQLAETANSAEDA